MSENVALLNAAAFASVVLESFSVSLSAEENSSFLIATASGHLIFAH